MPELDLTTDIQYLKGVGPRRGEILKAHGVDTVARLLMYTPRRYIDRSQVATIASLQENDYKTVVGTVRAKGLLRGGKTRLEVIIDDGTGILSLLWFAGWKYLEKQFKKGDELAVTGTVTYFQGFQILHPEYEFIGGEGDDQIHTGRIVPIYPLTAELQKAGLSSRVFRRLIKAALDTVRDKIDDVLPENIIAAEQIADLKTALIDIHFPSDEAAAERARRRLAFDELLTLQLMLQQRRSDYKEQTKARTCRRPGELFTKVIDNLPFDLTPGQKTALGSIVDDMTSSKPMNRLLQGDVGSGKTVVAVLAAVLAVENDGQAAIMVPTEILAEQHFANWEKPLKLAGINAAVLTGSLSAAGKKEIIAGLRSGYLNILFGTHALISRGVEFENLTLVIIDEQHRFGVMQRSKLAEKGRQPDRLVMTATPIPRTLALTLYGDLDVSTIPDLPPGRKPVRTVWRPASKLGDIYRYIDAELDRKNQVFVIFPLVEKSEKLDLQAAEEGFEELKGLLPGRRIGLVHGRVKADQRDKIIGEFHDGKLDILVATTVIEVGIDIPGATILIIQHAERFGLSQLHQMRGRVGRGDKAGLAVAVAYPPISDMARKRLEYFASTTDGFKIAEADLELRGPGEFFGIRQHGLPEFRLANPITDQDLVARASYWAKTLIASEGKKSPTIQFLLKNAAIISTLRVDLIDVA